MKKLLLLLAVLGTALQNVQAYSKYGRTCKDIGCLNNEVCVMAEDPCSYYNKDSCGMYPTCKSSGDSDGPSCSKFACPPTQICNIDNGEPKCVPADSTSSKVRPVHSDGAANIPDVPYPNLPAQTTPRPRVNYQPNAPPYMPPAPNGAYPNLPPAGGLYPSITTPRPRVNQGYQPQGGGGYAGSAPNSGYPGAAPNSGYPGQGYPNQGYPSQGGYPVQSGYPNQGYPQGNPNQGYPNQGYPNQGYPNQGYPNQGYPQGYPNQQHTQRTGYQQNTRKPSSGSNPIVDKITGQLKSIGTSLLRNILTPKN